MRDFMRSLFITFSAAALFFILLFGFVAVSEAAAENGFSSGEVLYLSVNEGIIAGELFGSRFTADISALLSALEKLRGAVVAFPALWQVIIKCICSMG